MEPRRYEEERETHQEDVDHEVRAAAALEEYGQRRDEDGEAADIYVSRPSFRATSLRAYMIYRHVSARMHCDGIMDGVPYRRLVH